ncbi:cytochrome P450 3A56-like [Petromyzon marinus]|uniref:Cytochrome P450 3A56-like n=1 Tax=Petromyzon marinus TaxID=7757 RepID=A0AAJ7TUT2_PETMA|nr:cytochrome P450 3A56-like [Petromyzon marinus]
MGDPWLWGLSAETWVLVATLLVLMATYSMWPYNFFKRLNIPTPRPYPFIGTFLEYRKGWFNFDMECREKFGKIWGIYDGRSPVLMVADPSLYKTILVKDCYSTFTNRRNFQLNGPLNDALTVVEDEKWKRIRSVLSPVFSTGKLKEVFPIVKHYGDLLVQQAELKCNAGQSFDAKKLLGAYSMDVITSTAFSADVNSLSNEHDPFVAYINKLTKLGMFNPLLLLVVFFPAVTPLLVRMNVSMFPKDVLSFFMSNLQRLKSERRKGEHTDRVDFLQTMVDAQISDSVMDEHGGIIPYKALTDSEILSQAMVFLLAGYETTAVTLTYIAYNLAVHVDVQDKLLEEIDATLPPEEEVTYEKVSQLPYLDMVVSESLRLYPPAGRLERIAKMDVELGGIPVPKGTVIGIPVFVIHRNSEHWDDPTAFRPERFSKEAREQRDQYCYLPFGAGPRNCIGMRFALINVKIAIVSLLRRFTFVTCPETKIPAEIGIRGLLEPKEPIILKFAERKKSNQD